MLSCAAVMKPLYKQEMYTLRVNSTRNFNTVRSNSFAVFRCTVPVPSCACAHCFCLKLSQIKAVQYLFTQPFGHYRDQSAYPPHHRRYFTALKSTVDLDRRFLVRFTRSRVLSLPADPLGAVGPPHSHQASACSRRKSATPSMCFASVTIFVPSLLDQPHLLYV